MKKTTISTDGPLSGTRKKAGSTRNHMAYIQMKYWPLLMIPILFGLYDEAHSDFAETRFEGSAELQDFIIPWLAYTEPTWQAGLG
jgi:hypothetical protein